MSRFDDEVGVETLDEYENFETYLEGEEQLEEEATQEDYDYYKDIYALKRTMTDYCQDVSIPLCEYLSAEDLARFIETTLQ